MKPIYVLGIETSCDETAAGVYHSEKGILSNFLFSQTEIHKNFGGVVPEIGSRWQLERINSIVKMALEKANVTLDQVDVIAVTNKPGLPGSLLVGVCFSKALAWASGKKLIGVNHLEGHAFSTFLENNVPFPHLCMTASGGHTSLYLMEDFGKYTPIGQTVDDAAGEAFDKIARMIGHQYPGGPAIEKRAREVNFQDFFGYPRASKNSWNFSFSGLKTAVMYDLVKKGAYDIKSKKFLQPGNEELKNQVASSLLVCIADIFEHKLKRAIDEYPQIKAISFVGGVACNKYIREQLQALAHKNDLEFYTPSPQYCTDNGAMIAFVGHYMAQRGEFDDLSLDIF